MLKTGSTPFLLLASALLAGCGESGSDQGSAGWKSNEPLTSPAADSVVVNVRHALPEKLQVSHLPNAIRVHDKVISGGLPEGDAAFAELQQLGVRTVISVDGAKPDLELAHKYGMTYVHIPHSYDGVPEHQAQQLAKAVQVLEGPFYIHCHHGKHRSPAAAAVACVSAGLLDPSASLEILKLAGTSPDYRGLYNSAESAQRIDQSVLGALTAEFPETAVLPEMAEAMVALEHTSDRMKLVAAAGWWTPETHRDVDPAHESLLLKEHFVELLRMSESEKRPELFLASLRGSEQAAGELEAALRAWNEEGHPQPVPQTFAAAFDRVSVACKSCHKQFRDIPLNEKLR